METKELIEQLRSCGTRNCPECPEIESCAGPSVIMRAAAKCLNELEKKYTAAVEMAATATELAAVARKVDGDLISRAALIAEIKRIGGHNLCEWETIGVLALAERIPAVEAEPVVHAHWVPEEGGGYGDDVVMISGCSNCGNQVCHHGYDCPDKRCKFCGAYMDEPIKTGYCPLYDKEIEVRSNANSGNCPDCGHHVVLYREEVADEKMR